MPVSPIALMGMKRADTVITQNSKVLMGHNRAATRGMLTVENSHPFWTGKYMVAHNGTLDYSCLKDLAKNRQGDTDSEQLANSIHELDSVKDALALTTGAWALTIYNHEANTITLVRNDQRPLYYAMAEDRDTLYWASEPGMLRWILDRNSLNYSKKIYELPVDTMFTWGIPGSKEIFQEKPQRLEAKGKRVQNFQYGGPNNNNRQSWEQWAGQRGSPNANGSGYNRGELASIRDKDHAGFSAEDVRALRAAPFNEVEGEIYGLGWQDAEADLPENNPFSVTQDFDKWSQYGDGYKAGKNRPSLKREKTDKIDESLPFLLGDGPPDAKSQKEALAIKEAAEIENVIPLRSPVIIVGDDAPKKSNIFGSRIGPNGRRISPAKFKELTKHKCGWCDESFTSEDKGRFETIPGYGDIYVADCCAKDPNLLQEMTDVNPPKEQAKKA